MRQRRIERGKRQVRCKGYLRFHNRRRWQAHAVFFDLNKVSEVDFGGIRQQWRRFLHIEIPAVTFRKTDITNGAQRHANQNLHAFAIGLDEHIDDYVARNVVGHDATTGRDEEGSR